MSDQQAKITEYLDGLVPDARPTVEQVLDAVRAGLPDADERFRYGMPAVMLDDRYALHVGGWKRHVGVYPVGQLPEPLESEVAPYRAAKDALNFRYADPVPLALITQVAAELRRRRVGADGEDVSPAAP